MPANIPDTGAINNLGGQFTHNIFAGAQKNLNMKSRQLSAQHQSGVKTAEANRNAYANSAAQAVNKGRAAFVKNQQTQAKQAATAAKTHAAGVKSGRVAPASGEAPRTFAMGTTPQQKTQAKATAANTKTMQQQMNFAHGQALTFQAAQFKTKQSQTNYAHGQAIQQQKQMDKQKGKGSVTTPAAPKLTPGFSTTPLPTLTANQPKPNTFTTGSRNAKPGGIAARGSQLESWAMGKQAQVRAKRGTGT